MLSVQYSELYDDATRAEFEQLVDAFNALWLEEHNEDGTHVEEQIVAITSSEVNLPIGSIIPYAGAAAPTGWLLCDGTAVSRATYASLYAVITTTYGVGDGATTFNLPDLRQRFPLGKAASGTGSTLGSTGGAIDHTHVGAAHTHAITSGGAHTHTGPSHTHDTLVPRDGWGSGAAAAGRLLLSDGGALPAGTVTAAADRTFTSTAAGTGATGSDGAHDHGAATGSGGAGTTTSGNPPFLSLNYLILYS